MRDLSGFHRSANELLHHLGFNTAEPAADQDVIGFSVDRRFTVHFGCIDDRYWFIQADLGGVSGTDAAQFSQALRSNLLADKPWLPVAALDADNHLVCWLRLPAQGSELPALVEAFDTVVLSAERLLQPAAFVRSPLPSR